MNIWTTLDKAVRLFPHQQALIDKDIRLTYAQTGRRVRRLAQALTGLGLTSQDSVSVIAPNSIPYYEAYYTCAGLGLILNSINFRLAGSEMAYIINDADARVVMADVRFAETVRKALRACPDVTEVIWIGPDSPTSGGRNNHAYEELIESQPGGFAMPEPIGDDKPAHLYYTSGTTGRPKGVVLTHRNVTTHAMAAIAELKLTDADTWFHVAPMFHLADAWACFALTWVGGRHVMLADTDPGDILEMIDSHGITSTNLIPTILTMMLNHPKVSEGDYSSLRFIASGGAPIAPETVRAIVDTFGCQYVQTYGLTETSPYCTVCLPKAAMDGLSRGELLKVISRTGREYLPVELRVVDDTGSDVPGDDKTVGEIWVRGDTVTPGYWKLPQATAEAFEGDWFKTGDLAVIDSEGYVNIVDRKKDIIISGGENIYSTEVDYALYDHPAVLECATIGVPDDKWGEAVKAVVVLKEGMSADEAELIDWVKDRLARYKAPKSVDFVAELPKTGSGKIRKKSLKERYWAGRDKRVG